VVVTAASPGPVPVGRDPQPVGGRDRALLPFGAATAPPPSTLVADAVFASGALTNPVDYPGTTEEGDHSGSLLESAHPLDPQRAADLGWDGPGEDPASQQWWWPEGRRNRRG
jgi:hypothetical protein